MTRIILVGFMGAGKTTLGKALAANLKLSFIDLDVYIEQRFRKSVSQLFDERGEEHFRLLEHNMLRETAEFEDVIISAGGGTPCFYDNMDYMNAQGTTVYLKAAPQVLFNRLSVGKAKRPLLKKMNGTEMMQYITKTLYLREQYYGKAKFVFKAEYLENAEQIRQSVMELKELLNLNP